MKKHITTTINITLYKEAKENSISLSEALEFGISFLIAEKTGFNYPNCSFINEKIPKLQKIISEQNEKIEQLKINQKITENEN